MLTKQSWMYKMKDKKGKLATPEWILKGYDSEDEYLKKTGKVVKKKTGKTFKIRRCPECGSDNVGVILGGEEGKGTRGWECHSCKWRGKNITEEEVDEDKFMKY